MPFWAFVGLTTLGTWFGFANPLIHIPPLVLTFPAGLAAIALVARSPRQAFVSGWILGTAVATLCLYWIVIPVHRYGHLPLLLALPCPVLIGSVLGLYASLYTLLIHGTRHRLPWPLHVFFAGCLWALLDWVQEWALTGFPWLTLPGAFSVWPWAVDAVRFVGTHGLAGILAALAMFAVYFGQTPRAFMGVAVIILGLGLPLLDPPAHPTGPNLRAIIVQGGIDQDHKWDPTFQNATVNVYTRLSRNASALHGTQLIVWPETAMPFYFQDDNHLQRQVRDLARQTNATLVLGAPGYTTTLENAQGYVLFNRAFLVTPEGRISSWYDKRHLVPFGEYIPLSSWFPFIRKLVVGAMDFSPGYSSAPLVQGDLSLGMLICYEAIFSNLAQESVAHGANILVNISNDTWFGASSAPWQHLYLSVLRAIEQNRFLIRCTNTGISAFIDNRGHIFDTSELFKKQTLVQDTLKPIEATTFYHDWYAYIHAGYALFPMLVGLWAWTRKPVARA
ncbi:apolipoprotein N-acyltransferase [Desulfoplanes formicivorans]|uniref:Apolipoprotein N-acyltransferase n=2 Tax=Desulfoplanes formicivorans TaxID=1592317 RepID=A0A194AGW6_9BACT|nr:apolipoprotein N-acyltransferase [Desulfoplanes formicivorans]